MRARSPNTGPPVGARNVDAVAAANRHGTQSRRQPSSARDNLQFGFLRQVAKRPLGLAHVKRAASAELSALLAHNGCRKEGGVNAKLSATMALRPTSELKRCLEVFERRVDFDRAKTLSLLSVRAAIQTELARRAALCELAFIGWEPRQ